jgi:hypothetical protein
MSELASLLSRPDVLSTRIKARPIEPVALQRLAQSLPGVSGSRLSMEQTGELQRRLHEAAAAGEVDQLRSRDIREGCKVFLHAPAPIIESARTSDAVLRRVEDKAQRPAVLALITAYIDGFREGEQFGAFASRVRQLVGRWSGRPISPWPELHKSVSLFEPSKAPVNIAAAVLGGGQPPGEVLNRLGLDTEIRQRGGLAEASFIEATRVVMAKQGPAVIPLQERIIEWGMTAEGRLSFAKALPATVNALLLPWCDADPPDMHRTHLIDVLMSLGGGDPRTKPGQWRDVQQTASEAYSVLIRWLTRASVFQFFDIVDQSLAKDLQGRTMWAYRRRFWTSYLLGEEDAPTIEEAWVAFGEEGAWLARKAARESQEAGFAAFGTQEDRSATHAALIMRIGDWTIVDWSHNAKCNFWRRGASEAPQLYRPRYPSGTLYSAPRKHSHASPATYTWQKTFAEIIEGKRFYTERLSWRPKRA